MTPSAAPTAAAQRRSINGLNQVGRASEPTGELRTSAPDPVWDIELDLNSPSPPSPEAARDPPTTGPEPGLPASKRVREESPRWDIEDDATPALRDLDSGLDEDDDPDVDMDDIAPALRAKRRRA